MEKTVLIADDDESSLELYKHFLKKKGYEVIAVKNGREAIEIMEKRKLNAVILDLAMPEVSGEAVMEWMVNNGNWNQVLTIVDTAMGSERAKRVQEQFGKSLKLYIYQRPSSLEEIEKILSKEIAF